MRHPKIRKLTPKQRRLWELEKFLLKMVVLVIPVYLIITFGVNLGPAQLEVARESHWFLGATGFNATLYGTGILAEFAGKAPFFFTISADCTGWKAMLFFAALVLAVPRRTWKPRIIGLAAGLAAIWIVNLFRVAAVVSTYSSYGPGAAMLVHDYLWQVGMGLSALLLWAVWLRLTKGKQRN
jgi:exosortase/archaeosortase family protein